MQSKLFALAASVALYSTAAAADHCSVIKFGELPVTMVAGQPTIPGRINGRSAAFLADSGGFFSTLSLQTLQDYDLKLGSDSRSLEISGLGGSEVARVIKIRELELTGLFLGPLHDIEFLVMARGVANGIAGIIGQNVLGHRDTEYDLANGVIRLLRTQGCERSVLAYWHASNGYAVMDIARTSEQAPQVVSTATLNGRQIRVVFDTGTPVSMLTQRAAARVGVNAGDPGVVAGGTVGGVGGLVRETWIAPFTSLDLGGEQVNNIRLRVADVGLKADLILGADFFLSHRIIVSTSQHKLAFTYNGGPVFDLSVHKDSQAEGVGPAGETAGDAASDVAGIRRRAAALAARHELPSALAEFARALELAPTDAETFYQRGLVYSQNEQPALALSDFDRAVNLDPNKTPALLSRAELRVAMNDTTGARADFVSAAQGAREDAALSLHIAEFSEQYGLYDTAIALFDQWIHDHPTDQRLAEALNNRCWSRASLGKDLDLALQDCDAALLRNVHDAHSFNSRGLVRLRQGDWDKAIADYKAALRLQHDSASSMYGLGLAEARKGARGEGERHMQAAVALRPTVVKEFEKIGVAP